MLKIKRISTSRRNLLLGLLITLLIAGALAYAYLGQKNNNSPDEKPQTDPSGINYSPPTEEEKKSGDNKKESIVDDSTLQNSDSVKPIFTYLEQFEGNIEATARVPGIFEDKGTCTFELSKDGTTKTAQRSATPNVSEMSCGLMKISRSDLSAGKWQATVSYKSNKISGTSEVRYIEVK